MQFPIEKFRELTTPFYYYDMALFERTVKAMLESASNVDYSVHYAIKACSVPEILEVIKKYGLGVDCVSGREVKAALNAGIMPQKIVFAGVGKQDAEIESALDADIFCFNVESVEELEIINLIAGKKCKKARVCLRINPDIDAHTHHHITTGLKEDKFGIQMEDMEKAVALCQQFHNIEFMGLHFHIGSQITDMQPYIDLCSRVNDLVGSLESKGIEVKNINVGGGLGIDYKEPDEHSIPDFASFFGVFKKHLRLRSGQTLHFELGRSLVGQCGSLITRVIYVKHGKEKNFVIADAGMTDLIRPALYGAYHRIDNLTSSSSEYGVYDVVGPICESSDVFVRDYAMPLTQRGDILAIRSAGAYGEVMASQYNMRPLPKHIISAID